jgi:hypothetical protein
MQSLPNPKPQGFGADIRKIGMRMCLAHALASLCINILLKMQYSI